MDVLFHWFYGFLEAGVILRAELMTRSHISHLMSWSVADVFAPDDQSQKIRKKHQKGLSKTILFVYPVH